jgi:hypothetical protein
MTQPPPPGYVPPPPQNQANFKPLLIGCGIALVLVLIVGGIGTWFAMRAVSSAWHTASDVAQVAKGAAEGAQQAAAQAGASPDAGQQAAAGVAVLKGLINGGKGNVQALSRDDLKTYLPTSIGSLARSSAESSAGSIEGISGTSATANYGDTNGSLTVDVTDAVNMPGLTTLMDILMNVESEDDEGYQKTVQLGDVKVHEKWTNAGKHSELIGIVNNRFAVSITGNGVDMGTAEQAFQAVDIAKLESVPAPAPAPAAT